jgi:membrane protease YdiL (CAAX protease family)
VGDLVLYFVIPLLLFLTIGRERWRQLRSIGLSLGERRTTLRMTVTLLLLASLMAFVGLFSPSMTRYYPIWSTGGEVSVADFAYNEFLFALIMFSGEFFYRGLVLLTLGRRSFWGAIVLQSIPYAFLHLGKPVIEVPYSFVAGLVFGWANLRSRSLLPSWLTHFMGSALFDALVLLT